MHLVWLRNDLRLADNPALHTACLQAIAAQTAVIAVYCATPTQWQRQGDAPAKIALQEDALNDLQPRLAQRGIALQVLEVGDFADCAAALANLAKHCAATHIHWNREVPLWEQARDQAVEKALSRLGVSTHHYEADFLVDPATMRNQQGQSYKVFTPWYKLWQQRLDLCRPLLPEPAAVGAPLDPSPPIRLDYGRSAYRRDLWPGSETAAQQKLTQFAQQRLTAYAERRDIPSINGTSTLSPYFCSGLISARQCLAAVQQHNGEWRSDPWLREVAWREFYRYLMVSFPYLSKGLPFKADTQLMQWEHNPVQVEAWQQGRTGYPIIDAAQRQLLQTGWMHNRLRMISASFFTKLLLEDWHLGEQFFMQHLLDGDFASNNGGWQWCASTGCDASPWFRVFNPQTQAEKFDPSGDFVRRFVPELASVPDKLIHNPPLTLRAQLNYPAPIIDYKMARERVLERFKALTEMSRHV